jgi:hypothetical protein
LEQSGGKIITDHNAPAAMHFLQFGTIPLTHRHLLAIYKKIHRTTHFSTIPVALP